MATVTYQNATCVYQGAERPSVDSLNLEIQDGEFIVLVGPSGCGKSTSLRMLAGLEEATSGSIRIGDRDITDIPSNERDIAMVFQNYALYPHMTVGANMGFALKIAGVPKAEREAKVRAAAAQLNLTEVLDRKPKELSGGQRQRVAMGRAIVREPQVFLMDEPLSNLDAKLRVQMRGQISALQDRLGVTTVYVTHDQTEAMTMGDRIAVLNAGKLQQVATPQEMYERPANLFVAGFIGSPAMTLHAKEITGGGVSFGDVHVPLPDEHTNGRSSIVVGIRPEDLRVGERGTPAVVDLVEQLGADAYVYAHSGEAPTDVDESNSQEIIIRLAGGDRAPSIGQTIRVLPDPERIHLFDSDSGLRVN